MFRPISSTDDDEKSARDHIERFSKGIDRNQSSDPDDWKLQSLDGALDLLSRQLYNDESHFLQELIQNLDDTEYEADVIPEVRFVVHFDPDDTYLRVWSNQVGFKPKDIQAICAINRSSKKGDLNSTGEKGIGFKSVFKIADIVTICSRSYRFEFDTTTALGDLGMLIPFWLDSPPDTTSLKLPAGGTLISLRLRPLHVQNIISTLRNDFQYTSLLFTRKLRKASICRHLGITLSWTEGHLNPVSEHIVNLSYKSRGSEQNVSKYVLWEHEPRTMPADPRRKSPTTIRLAFPYLGPDNVSNDQISLPSQSVFAFQEFGDFGFSFMLHADFILDTSRGAVMLKESWNEALRQELSTAAVAAFTWLARDPASPIPIAWPKFLNCLPFVSDRYFGAVAKKITYDLSDLPLVATEAGKRNTKHQPSHFRAPRAVTLLSPRYCEQGRPLLDAPSLLANYAINDYSIAARKALTLLSARNMDSLTFIEFLRSMIKDPLGNFRSKCASWQSSVAQLLSSILISPVSSRENLRKIQELEIVPLSDGHWTWATQPNLSNLFLPDASGRDIPSGIILKTVERSASSEFSRRILYKQLGIRTSDPQEVSRLIVQRHREARDCDWTHEQLLEQSVYLFHARFNPRSGDNLYFIRPGGAASKLPKAVSPFGERGRYLRNTFGYDNCMVSWLDERYDNPDGMEDTNRDRWHRWLTNWSNVTDCVPVMSTDGNVSPAIQNLKIRKGSKKMLTYFRVSQRALPRRGSRWYKEVGNMDVETNHGSCKLQVTTLPSLSKEACGLLPLLDLEVPDLDWTFLQSFGVRVTIRLEFYLDLLRQLNTENSGQDLDQVTRWIYAAIGQLRGVENDRVRDIFSQEKLIFAGDGTWCALRDVRWSSRFDYTRLPLLSRRYAESKHLFQTVLGLRSTDLADLMAEISHHSALFQSTEVEKPLEIFKGLLQGLEELLDGRQSKRRVNQLREIRMFPVWWPRTGQQEQELRLCSASNDCFWIPDISTLYDSFLGRIPLLDRSTFVKPVKRSKKTQFSKMFEDLKMEDMLLSNAVHYDYDWDESDRTLDAKLTEKIKEKIPYLHGILNCEMLPEATVQAHVARLHRVQAFKVPNIRIRKHVSDGSARYDGADDFSGLQISPKASEFEIYIQHDLPPSDLVACLAKEMAKALELDSPPTPLFTVLSSDNPGRFLEDLELEGARSVFQGSNTASPTLGPEDTENDVFAGSTPELDSDSSTPVMQTGNQSATGGSEGAVEQHQEERYSVESSDQLDAVYAASDKTSASGQHRDIDREYHPRSGPSPLNASSREPPEESQTSSISEDLLPRLEGLSITDETSFKGAASTARLSKQDSAAHDTSNNSDPMRLPNDHLSATPRPPQTPGRAAGLEVPSTFRRSWSHSPGQTRSPSRPQASTWDATHSVSETNQFHEIGRAGEYFLFEFLKEKLGSSFTPKNWTSSARQHYFLDLGLPSVPEKRYADFTFEDGNSILAQYLASTLGWSGDADGNTTFHLEVKSTVNGLGEPCLLSSNQMRLARKNSPALAARESPLKDVYVLVRVYDLRSQPRIAFFVDPWALIFQGDLEVMWPLKTEVLPASTSEKSRLKSSIMGHDATSALNQGLEVAVRHERLPSDSPSASFHSEVQRAEPTVFPKDFKFNFSSTLERLDIPSRTGPVPSTIFQPFQATEEVENNNSVLSRQVLRYQSVTMMENFRQYSFEELRLADYNFVFEFPAFTSHSIDGGH